MSNLDPGLVTLILSVLAALQVFFGTKTVQHEQALSKLPRRRTDSASVASSMNSTKRSLAKAGGNSLAVAPSGSAPGLSAPVWNQLNDPLPDGTQDAYSTSDCGEECVAELVRAVQGVTLSAGDVRFSLGGAARQGLTTGPDLVKALALSDVPATALSLDATDAWATIRDATSTGRGCIVLVLFEGGPELHWILATAISGGILRANDPWGGIRTTYGKSRFALAYQGTVVRADQKVRPEYMG